jgi:GNAT superfamily N-acetyltransferase
LNPIIHRSRTLERPPPVPELAGVGVRTYKGSDDIERWLDLRARAFGGQVPAVRPWTQADFTAEFLNKPWWSPERMWFAEAEGVIGSVTLALRGQAPVALPVVHWLMVLPEWRRNGVAKLLMATLEMACWQHGYREVGLETHSGWAEAEAFYRALGYDRDER